jgi:hypothetical protein
MDKSKRCANKQFSTKELVMNVKDLKECRIGFERALVQYYLASYDALIEDWWTQITPDLDLNLWVDEEDNLHATVYDVIDGNTQTVDPKNQLVVFIPNTTTTRKFVTSVTCKRGLLKLRDSGFIKVTRSFIEGGKLVEHNTYYRYTPEREVKFQEFYPSTAEMETVVYKFPAQPTSANTKRRIP